MAKLDANSQEMRDVLNTLIVDQYDSEEERESTRQLVGEALGIDWQTGLSTEPEAEAEAEPEADPAADALRELLGAGKDATGSPPAGGTDPEAGEGTGSPPQTQADADAERDRELAELRAKVQLQEQQPDIRKEIEARVAAEDAAKHAEADAEAAKRIEDMVEAYGEEAARPLREATDRLREMREAETRRRIEEETERELSKRREDMQDTESQHAAMERHPDLVRWYADAKAAADGEDGRSKAEWMMAVAYDEALRVQDAWKDRPQHERYGKVVELVKQGLDGSLAGAPRPSKPTDQRIAEEIARKGGGIELPRSMSHIQGGEAGANDLGARLQDMTAAEIAAIDGLSTEAIDQVLLSMD